MSYNTPSMNERRSRRAQYADQVLGRHVTIAIHRYKQMPSVRDVSGLDTLQDKITAWSAGATNLVVITSQIEERGRFAKARVELGSRAHFELPRLVFQLDSVSIDNTAVASSLSVLEPDEEEVLDALVAGTDFWDSTESIIPRTTVAVSIAGRDQVDQAQITFAWRDNDEGVHTNGQIQKEGSPFYLFDTSLAVPVVDFALMRQRVLALTEQAA